MKRMISMAAVTVVVVLFFVSLSVFSVFGASETTVDSEGWVTYTRLNYAAATYKVDTGTSMTSKTQTFSNIPLPYGPRNVMITEGVVSDFWVNVSLNNVDPDSLENLSIVTIPPGESVVLSAGIKLWTFYYLSENAFIPLDLNLYECRIYLDENYNRYLSPTLSVSANNGGQLYWSFTNNTDKPIELSRVAMGMFENSGSSVTKDTYGFRFYLNKIMYRMVSSSQMSAQVISDAIVESTSQIVDGLTDLGYKIDGFGDQIESGIQQSTDQITGGWSPDPVPPEGSEEIDEYHAVEQQLLDASQGGILSGLTFVGDLTSNMTVFNNGFLGMVKIWDLFNAIPWLRTVVFISLALGIIGFFLSFAPSARK